MMDFLELNGKNIVIFGVANRRSVAYAVSRVLETAGARLLHVVRDDDTRRRAAKLLGDWPTYICNVESEAELKALAAAVGNRSEPIHGVLHSIAFANYSAGFCPFHQTGKRDFLQAMDISCFSLVAVANAFDAVLAPGAAIVTISISTTRMAAQNYGYMGPVKAALDSTVAFLAKSMCTPKRPIRVNAVGAGLLKTSASAGIPGYVDAYLHAEKVIPRKRALATEEVADVAAFLLSPRSGGISAQTVIVDAAMSINYFDDEVVRGNQEIRLR